MSKSQIRREIRQKQAQQRQCEQVKTKITREIGILEGQKEHWQDAEMFFMQERMIGEVVVRGCFEGVSAKKLRTYLFDGIQYKNSKLAFVNQVIDDARSLQGRISAHIDKLDWEIQRLYDELDRYDD